MSVADGEKIRLQVYDFVQVSSGEADTFYADVADQPGAPNDLPHFINSNYKSGNMTTMYPIAKWLELAAGRMDEFSIDHGWDVEHPGAYIYDSGLTWEKYYGTIRDRFVPNSGYPYQLRGYAVTSSDFWRETDARMTWAYDKVVYYTAGGARYLTSNSYSDLVYNYEEVSGYIERWEDIIPHFNKVPYVLFDPGGSGTTLFGEYPPGDNASSDLDKLIYNLPSGNHINFSGLPTQYRLTQRQGFTRPNNIWDAFRNKEQTFNQQNVPLLEQLETVTRTVGGFGGGFDALPNIFIMDKKAWIQGSDSYPTISSGIAKVTDEIDTQKWLRNEEGAPNQVGFEGGLTNDNFIGNYQFLNTYPCYNTQEYDTGYKTIGWTLDQIHPFYSGHFDNESTGLSGYIIDIPGSGDEDNDKRYTLGMQTSAVYGAIPLSLRSLAKLTEGGPSGIIHRLNDRHLNHNKAQSVRSRTGFVEEDFNELFYPSESDNYYGLPLDYFGHIYYPTLTPAEWCPNQISPSHRNCYFNGVFNSPLGADGVDVQLGNTNSMNITMANLNSILVGLQDNLTYGPSEGCECVYGFIDIISEIDAHNIAVLGSGLNWDAYDYYQWCAASFSVAARTADTPGGLGQDLGRVYLHHSGGLYFSDVIMERLEDGDYTHLFDINNTTSQYLSPNLDLKNSGILGLAFERSPLGWNYSGRFFHEREISFPFSHWSAIPPSGATHMFIAVKPENFKESFALSDTGTFVADLYTSFYIVTSGEPPDDEDFIMTSASQVQNYSRSVNGGSGNLICQTDIPIPGSFKIGEQWNYVDGFDLVTDAFSTAGPRINTSGLVEYTTGARVVFDMMEASTGGSLALYLKGLFYATHYLHADEYTNAAEPGDPDPAILVSGEWIEGNFKAKVFDSGLPPKKMPWEIL